MTGGYVMFDGDETNKVHRPPGSRNEYRLKKGIYTQVKDKQDYEWYHLRASRSDPKDQIWFAKVRLGKGDVSYDMQVAKRPLIDKTDPNFEADHLRKDAYFEYLEQRERFRRYFGSNLPEGLKIAKKLYGGEK